jgi:hypothetical protein
MNRPLLPGSPFRWVPKKQVRNDAAMTLIKDRIFTGVVVLPPEGDEKPKSLLT